ncbi:glycine dehydrogenase subunit 2 [Clostridium collagenovorans DSM 3089]|uniref:glycine dehydrogenase (aminomethyl-transferring) n=1 Tax=Clostridium collagenovorans DSM 3089 TaxID=1121306 RepID=A0A1M5W1A3_9CLOT|nr:aminomethyl-transferring glycine dehydrogenase subunit GcvPB [Clostridium collagenovorans]SHH81210.1 glycine dehydrogenase subunit 2 [Clostridium collagenovorans DSM 3089]
MKKIKRDHKVRQFHQAKWDEPIIFELSRPGQRGVVPPLSECEIVEQVGSGLDRLPSKLVRKEEPKLPEIEQLKVLRHYLRLSQETLGADFNVEIGQGTCTMKYSPKINEVLAKMPKITELHPLQDESTVQGILEVMYKLDLYMREISGMDRFTMQPSGGSQAIMTMASLVRAYHESKGEGEQRDEIITTMFSHPSDAAAAAIKGYKIITIYPDKEGYPDFEAFKAAVSERTAAFIVANPEDTGVYNKRVQEFTKLVHEAGGLCCYDQANANGLLGVTRAKEADFDMCFFNLHKTFSTPHGCGGPATGAVGVLKYLEEFMPGPLVDFDGEKYFLNYDIKNSIGKVRSFYGVPQVMLKAYSWIMSLGAEGLYEVAKIAVLNNNYLYKKILEIKGMSAPYIEGKQRIEQVRYSMEELRQETGIEVEDFQNRIFDFGLHFWTSHHPYIVPSPFTLEPTETTSKEDMDEYIEAFKHIVNEAYTNPKIVKTAPHNSVVHKIDCTDLDIPEKWCVTWRSYLKKAEN